MDIYETWEKALKKTEIVRSRVKALLTNADTQVPYIFLSESSINLGDTVVRKGKIAVQRPSIILPPHVPQFEGFELEKRNEEYVTNFMLMRGVSIPSYQYNNTTVALDIYEGTLAQAVKHYHESLQMKEDVHTGLIIGPEEGWQFSILIFICSQVARNADRDIKKLMEEFRRKDNDDQNS